MKNKQRASLILLLLIIFFISDIVRSQCDDYIYIIDNSNIAPTNVETADFDNDGDIDLSAGDYDTDAFYWYEYTGIASYEKHTLNTSKNGAVWVKAIDLDSDLDIDIIGVSQIASGLLWYENDGSGNFTEHTITAAGGLSVDAGDVDNDGDIDIIVNDGSLVVYYNDGSEDFTNTSQFTVFGNAFMTKSFLFNIDADDYIDVIAVSSASDYVVWFQNEGNGSYLPNYIDTELEGPNDVDAVDLDGDGDLDVISGFYDTGGDVYDQIIVWYENSGGGSFTKRNITNIRPIDSIRGADIDGDDVPEIVTADYYSDVITIYKNDGTDNFYPLNLTLSGTLGNPSHISLKDLNEDDLADIIISDDVDSNLLYIDSSQCSIGDLGIVNIGYACESSDDCLSGKCEGGYCVLKLGKESCTSNSQCLSGECVNGKCSKPSAWDLIEATKDETVGDDPNTNNFLSLFLMIGITAVIVFAGRSGVAVFIGILIFLVLSFFFAIIGWLSPFILLAELIGVLAIVVFLFLIRASE